MLRNIANPKIIIHPNIIGFIKYSNDALPIITIIGLPPAGGWTIFNKKNISRKECLLLPLKTVQKALENKWI